MRGCLRHPRAVVGATVLSLACAGSSDVEEVRETVSGIIAADNARDLTMVMASYTPDITFLPPDERAVRGRPVIEDRYRALFRDARPHLTVTLEDADVDGDLAYAWGTTGGTLVAANGADTSVVADKYLMILRREDAAWKVSHLIWNRQPSGTNDGR